MNDEQLEEQIKTLSKECQDLRDLIESSGGGVDLGTSRVDILIEKLVEWGIMTRSQYLRYELAYLSNLHEALTRIDKRLKDIHAEAERQMRLAQLMQGNIGQPVQNLKGL